MPPTDPSANQAVGSIVQTFISAFTAAPATLLTEAGTAAYGKAVPISLANSAVSMQQNNSDPNAPAAFLNYILYDENMNIIPGGSGAIQISQASANSWQSLPTQTVSIPQNGFMRVFTSNTSLVDVRFDNLIISFYKGELLEEYNYYPYGLIFDQHQAFSGLTTTNYLYNGKELQQNEFGAGGNGLSLYDYGARMYDPQIGRWDGVDLAAIKYADLSPFTYVGGNPTLRIDKDGKDWFVNNKTGQILFIKGATEICQEMLDKFSGGYNANDFQRLGEDNMFGYKAYDADGSNILEHQWMFVQNSQKFMKEQGYEEAERVTIKEQEIKWAGSEGPGKLKWDEFSTLEQVGNSQITYVKPAELNTKEIRDEESYHPNTRWYSAHILYNLIKPYGQDNHVTAEYRGNRREGENDKKTEILLTALEFIKTLLEK